MLSSDPDAQLDESERAFGSVRYGIMPLMTIGPRGGAVIGMLALGFHQGTPQMPEHEVLHAIGTHLGRADA